MSENNIVDPAEFGVSFSVKQCRNFGQEPQETLSWLISQGFRRYRLMSYWDEHEARQGAYDFSQLDWQFNMIEKIGGEVTLCLGARQPRWPENHWPKWALEMSQDERTKALMEYVQVVVERYRSRNILVSYQLENEALLKNFGENSEIDRLRLVAEKTMVRRLDPSRPVIMTTSTSWGIPLRRPIPSAVGFSVYNVVYDSKRGKYGGKEQKPWVYRLRAALIWVLWRRKSFIHELQLEPWGPRAIWEMDKAEQERSMSVDQIKRNLTVAKAMNLYPIDLWGGEWWYQRFKDGDSSIIEQVISEAC